MDDYRENFNTWVKESEFDKAVERYGQLRQGRVPVISNFKGYARNNTISLQDQDQRRISLKKSVEAKDKMRALLGQNKASNRTSMAQIMPITSSFSSIQSAGSAEKEPGRFTGSVKLLNPVSEDMSTKMEHYSNTHHESQRYVQVMLNSKQEGETKEKALDTTTTTV